MNYLKALVIRITITSFLLLIVLPSVVRAQESNKSFTIYLVRHSEKVIDKDNLKDPPLTECGVERSENLALFLIAIEIEKIYSTNYVRTINTALPTSVKKNLEIDIYEPSDLKTFAEKLLKAGENALIVGHSNTTPMLASILSGTEYQSMHESVYNRIYQVIISNDDITMNVFHSSFKCNN